MDTQINGSKKRLVSEVASWLASFLEAQLPESKIDIRGCSLRTLSRVTVNLGLTERLPLYSMWDFHVDLSAFLVGNKKTGLVIVQCTQGAIKHEDIGKLFVCARLVNPVLSILVSPKGPDKRLRCLLQEKERLDILDYGGDSPLALVTWEPTRKQPDWSTTIPNRGLFVKGRF
jgi:hypothetical protein